MSLKAFHILFVTASSLLAFLFGGWCLHYGRTEEGGTGYFTLGVAAVLFGIGLIVYGFWFWRKITTREEEDRRRRKLIHRVRSVPLVFGVWILGQRAAEACTVCYGEATGPMIDGARVGVYLLFGLVLLMQISFAAFFITLRRRAKRTPEDASGR